jgi:SNF2 family DNA or RNA helicase
MTWGLGKTVQALAATELLRRHRGIRRVLVVAPASVKYQWKTEIEKFTKLDAQVIEGLVPQRQVQYAAPKFFNLTSYELVLKDIKYLHELQPDLIILDEAQRIRNWATATPRTIKQLKSRYAFVLTGTPLENQLEELFSVVEFVDGRRLGPAFRFLQEHRMEDENGKLLGYRGLDQIHQTPEPILLRRTRTEVLKDVPPRTDQIFRVPLTKEQAEPYWEQHDILARVMRKWQSKGWLSEIDLRRITCRLQNMRILCNSTFLFDKRTHHSRSLRPFMNDLAEFRPSVSQLQQAREMGAPTDAATRLLCRRCFRETRRQISRFCQSLCPPRSPQNQWLMWSQASCVGCGHRNALECQQILFVIGALGVQLLGSSGPLL